MTSAANRIRRGPRWAGLLDSVLLAGLVMVSGVEAAPASTAAGGDDTRSETGRSPLSGRIVHLNETPVPGADVRIYHVPSDDFREGERIAESETGPAGVYRLSSLDADDLTALRARYSGFVLLVARAPDRGWFQVDLFRAGDFFDDDELGTTVLSRQLLLAPAEARLRTNPLGMITVWRHVARSDPTQQTLFIEVADVSDDPRSVAHRLNQGSPLTGGAFTALVPEDGVQVDYDRLSLARAIVGSSPAPLELGGTRATPVARWHPSRTGLPVYAFTRSLETKTFTEYTEQQRRRAERNREARRLIMEQIVGTGKGTGAALSFLQVTADLVESPAGPSTTVGSGGQPADLNHQDRVEDGWIGEAHAAVFELPLSLEASGGSWPVELHAAWAGGQGRLDHRVELDVPAVSDGSGTDGGSGAGTATGRADLVVPGWMEVDHESRKIRLEIVSMGDNATELALNGYQDGSGRIVVPEGYRVTVDYRNEFIHPNGLMVLDQVGDYPAKMPRLEPAFPGAQTDGRIHPRTATQHRESESFTFTAAQTGEYALVCPLWAHAAHGEWIRLSVSPVRRAGFVSDSVDEQAQLAHQVELDFIEKQPEPEPGAPR